MTLSHASTIIARISLIFKYSILASTRRATQKKKKQRSGLQHGLLWRARFQHEYEIESVESSALFVSFEAGPFAAYRRKISSSRNVDIIRRASRNLSPGHSGQKPPLGFKHTVLATFPNNSRNAHDTRNGRFIPCSISQTLFLPPSVMNMSSVKTSPPSYEQPYVKGYPAPT